MQEAENKPLIGILLLMRQLARYKNTVVSYVSLYIYVQWKNDFFSKIILFGSVNNLIAHFIRLT